MQNARSAGASTRTSSGTAVLDHQYMKVGSGAVARIRTCTRNASAPAGSHASTWNTAPRSRSYSHIRSIGTPPGPVSSAACSGEQVVGLCPRVPMFHSTPPANQALRSARFAGCHTGLR
ncbi:hypothetical protein GCM10009635_62560 [Actinocatenispora thailandica]